MGCQRCGCQGHGTTRRATCALCGADKWPTLIGTTPQGWKCALCISEGAQVILARREHRQRQADARKRPA